MACRTAGRLGPGGGPLLFLPPRCRKAPVLQDRKGNQRHQRVPVQPCPRPTLGVVEPEFLFKLLVSLLADLARLGCSSGSRCFTTKCTNEVSTQRFQAEEPSKLIVK